MTNASGQQKAGRQWSVCPGGRGGQGPAVRADVHPYGEQPRLCFVHVSYSLYLFLQGSTDMVYR